MEKSPSRSRPLLGSDEASTVYLTTKHGDRKTDFDSLDKYKVDLPLLKVKKVYIKTHKDASDDTGNILAISIRVWIILECG